MEVEADSGLEQGHSRESSGNDNTGPTSSRHRPPHPQLLPPSSDQPDVVQTTVAVTTVAKDSEDKSVSKDCERETKSGNGGDENDYVEYPR